MANPFRGEAKLERTRADGAVETFVLRAGMNEMAKIQTALQVKGFTDIYAHITGISFTGTRLIVRTLLSKHHPKITPDEVDGIIDDVGLPEIIRVTTECMKNSLNGPHDEKAEKAVAEGEPDPNAQ